MPNQDLIPAPAYPDVWRWLWKEKGCFIQVIKFEGPIFIPYIFMKNENTGCSHDIRAHDPEEAVIEAINYMVDNDLIKKMNDENNVRL